MDRVRLLGLILAIPLIAMLVAYGARDYRETGIRAEALRRGWLHNGLSSSQASVEQLCAFPTGDMPDLCDSDRAVRVLGLIAAARALVGVGLMAGIAWAGRAARASRARLLALFARGLHITAAVITAMIITDALLVLGVFYYSGLRGGFILAVGIGSVLGVSAVSRSVFGVVRKAQLPALGVSLTRQAAPGLWAEVDRVAATLGSQTPDHVVAGLDPTFFVTEADVRLGASEMLTGRTLFCSLPLARMLTVDEWRSIVGHELGHFRGEDTQYSQFFAPIYHGAMASIASLHQIQHRGVSGLALLPAKDTFGFFLQCFHTAARGHDRERELLADSAGAEATSPRIAATALVKVHAFADRWGAIQREAISAVARGQLVPLCERYAAEVAASARPGALDGITDTHSSHPMDSHPTLGARLDGLGIDQASVRDDALRVSPEVPASSLLQGAEVASLERTYQLLLARQLGVTVPSALAERPGSLFVTCDACHTRVIPTSAGACPRCGTPMRTGTTDRAQG